CRELFSQLNNYPSRDSLKQDIGLRKDFKWSPAHAVGSGGPSNRPKAPRQVVVLLLRSRADGRYDGTFGVIAFSPARAARSCNSCAEATVNELAEALNLTDNAVRSHLSTLERDGPVRQSGKRTAVRKPEVLYSLTPEAGQLFPKAYDLLFNQLLHSLVHESPQQRKA